MVREYAPLCVKKFDHLLIDCHSTAFLSTDEQTQESITEYNVTSNGNICQPGYFFSVFSLCPLHFFIQLGRKSLLSFVCR
jgi:hypothetical protein